MKKWACKRSRAFRTMDGEPAVGTIHCVQHTSFQGHTMSMELHVLLESSRLPDVHQWQQTLDELGFDLKLEATKSVQDDTGFFPCSFKGRQSGFEFDIFPASEIAETYAEFEEQFTGRDASA